MNNLTIKMLFIAVCVAISSCKNSGSERNGIVSGGRGDSFQTRTSAKRDEAWGGDRYCSKESMGHAFGAVCDKTQSASGEGVRILVGSCCVAV